MSQTTAPATASNSAGAPDATLPAPEKPAFRYFRPPTAHQPPPELPESYFDATAADVRAQQAMLAARRDALQNAPLRTAAMREADDKKRRARWPHTTIRIKFSDRSILEKTFPSTDKIRSVYAFVRGSLREDVKPIKFVLYQSPPKREYKVSDPKVRDLTLLDLNFAPAAQLMIRFEDDRFNHPDVSAPLDAPVLSVIEDFPVPPDFDKDPNVGKDDKGSSSGGGKTLSSTLGGVTPSGDGERKLPKWLKLGPRNV
ncbi:hypothetical protein L226DRAFT_616978 [Lentinus tigrinus ALCF2SS1-7]|uniref:UBX domain-containing protein n=1 Tax=Lentinus tigrinus ALCF2SS1-6 TaxID=1328759 RepID=A0A5C2RVP3_9APHY|nr:hypothetical protein L227DRAFT_657635 [Lentinus tigrinus ALCF2SS1-6]RPD69310.1 hypothetical protein L226DRAFT_616978 [Lentinus tigrinus ALCF2SS1-7]